MHGPNLSRPLAPLYKVFLFGRFRIERRDPQGAYRPLRPSTWDRQSPQRVMAYLLLAPGRHTLKDPLLDALCPDDSLKKAQAVLATALSLVRSVLVDEQGCPLLLPRKATAQKPLVLVGHEQIWCDWDAFEDTLMQAQAEEQRGGNALPLWEQAYALCREEFLLEERYSDWCRDVRERTEGDQRLCLLHLAACYQQQGRSVDAERILRAWLSTHALDQDALCRLMEVLANQGRIQEALIWYRRTCKILAEEELEPIEATRALATRLREERHHPPLVSIDAGQTVPTQGTLQTAMSDTRAPFLLLPASTQKELVVSASSPSLSETSPSRQLANGLLLPVPPASDYFLAEATSGDCATWFSERLAHIMMFVTQWRGRMYTADFEKQLDRELRMFDAVKAMFDPDTYFLSRRSALLVIAALPKGLLGLFQQQKAAFIEEELLPACAASITACWYLLNGREFASVERALARYLPFLITWAHQPSSYQKRAAYLAAQACLLLGFIELHRLHFQQRIAYCREAVRHGREAGNHPLLVKALTQLGNAYYDQGMDVKMLQAYQEAKHLCTEDVPRSLQSKVLMGLAHAYAQQGKAAEALDTIKEAREIFPGEIEDVPAFLAADDGEYSLILFEGWIRLDLGKHYPDKAYNKQAAKALAQIDRLPTNTLIPERYRHEIINRRAQAAIALGELDVFCEYTLQSAQILKVMHSEKRRQELVSNYKTALKKWPGESTIVELADVAL